MLGDGEDFDAALGAAGVADEVLAAALAGVGYGGVYDGEKELRHGQIDEGWLDGFVRCGGLRGETWDTPLPDFSILIVT
jgi:hypothetical protein